MTKHSEATSELLQSANGVLSSVDLLKTAIKRGNRQDVDFAADLLAREADSYLGSEAKYERLGFDEIARAPKAAGPRRERVSSDLLASVMVDIETANTIIVAGRAAGEGAKPATLEELEEAAGRLTRLTVAISKPLGSSLDLPLAPGRFGFDEAPAAVSAIASKDRDMAKATYHQKVEEFYQTLVNTTKEVLKQTYQKLTELDPDKIGQALEQVGQTAMELPFFGRLISKGLNLALRALAKLTELLGLRSPDDLKEKVKEIYDKVTQGVDLLDSFINISYGVNKGKERLHHLLQKTKANLAEIDEGAVKVMELKARFSEQTAVVLRIVDGLSLGKRVVGLLLPATATVLLFGTTFLLAMAYVVLTGMDFADNAPFVNFVEGVLGVSEKVLI